MWTRIPLTLDISTDRLTFTDWARGAAVVGIQVVQERCDRRAAVSAALPAPAGRMTVRAVVALVWDRGGGVRHPPSERCTVSSTVEGVTSARERRKPSPDMQPTSTDNYYAS